MCVCICSKCEASHKNIVVRVNYLIAFTNSAVSLNTIANTNTWFEKCISNTLQLLVEKVLYLPEYKSHPIL